MGEISIRKYNDSDIDAVNRITEPIYYDEFKSFSGDKVFLALVNDDIVGWIHIDIPESSLYSGFVFVYIMPVYYAGFSP